jgi:hypothetical protein
MANLTWRDVSTPDVSGAIQGYRVFSDMLNNGLTNLGQGVTAFDGAKSELVNKQLALALAQQQDPTAIRDGLAAGRIGSFDLASVDPRRLSMETIQALQNRPGQLISQASSQLALNEGNLNFSQRQARDAQAGVRAQADAALRAGDRATAEKLLAGIDYSNFGYGAAADLNKDVQTTASNQVSNDQSLFNYQTNVRNDMEGRAAQAIAEQLRQAGMTGDERGFLLADLIAKGKISALGAAKVRQILGSELADPTGALAGATAGVGGGGAGSAPTGTSGGPAYGGNVWNTTFGFDKYGSADLTNMTLAEVNNFGKTVLGPKTKAAGIGKTASGEVVGTSAVGPFQIQSRSTMMDLAKEMGLDPNTTKFTPQVQEAMAQRIFEKSKGGNLQAVWASLPNAKPGAYKDMSWDQVKGLILKGEAGTDPQALALYNSAAGQGNRSYAMQNNPDSVATEMQQSTLQTGVSIEDAARQLVRGADGKGGVFGGKGVDEGLIVSKLNEVIARGRKAGVTINPATAAVILKNAPTGENLLERWAPGESLGNGQKVNWDQVDAMVKRLGSGGYQAAAINNDNIARNEGLRAAADAQVQTAYANLVRAKQAAAMNPNYNPVLLQRAQAVYQAALVQQRATLNGVQAQTPASAYGAPPQPVATTSPATKAIAKAVTPATLTPRPNESDFQFALRNGGLSPF